MDQAPLGRDRGPNQSLTVEETVIVVAMGEGTSASFYLGVQE